MAGVHVGEDVGTIHEPRPGARVDDPQRVAREPAWPAAGRRGGPNRLRLTEPRSGTAVFMGAEQFKKEQVAFHEPRTRNARQRPLPFAGLLLFVALFLPLEVARATAGPPSTNAPTSTVSTLVVIQGRVEVALAGSDLWKSARTNQVLLPGDRIRTGPRSRAQIRLSNQSVLPVDESTTLLIEAAPKPGGPPVIQLDLGQVYFHSRERPGDLRFRTRLATGAVRGTEFHLAIDENGRTRLAMIDGEVDLANDHGQLTLIKGDQALVEPGQPPAPTAAVEIADLIQWTFYYPGVLDPDDLDWPATDRTDYTAALEAWNRGALLDALARLPAPEAARTDAQRILTAAALLSVGQADDATRLLDQLPSQPAAADRNARLATALRRFIASVRGQPPNPAPDPAPDLTLGTEWLVESYVRQARRDLPGARAAAEQACATSARHGFAWVRLAELEFSFGATPAARRALDRGLELSPDNAAAAALAGFLAAADSRTRLALEAFDRALDLDSSLAPAWLGRGLCLIKRGRVAEGREALETAAVLEPRRSATRSYLGKAYAEQFELDLARKELALAREFDPLDPTAWLYEGLVKQQENRINEAVRDLERSKALNNNRQLYRSTLLLDQDRAVRGANLAAVYQDAGLTDVGVREATRAVNDDPSSYSTHLFLADSYNALRDPRQIALRYETAWLTEYLLSSLLSPVGASTLSQRVSQGEYSRLFDRDRLGLYSSTEYSSGGDWLESASQFGNLGTFGYALDVLYRSDNGERLNQDQEQLTFSTSAKWDLTAADRLYAQVIYYDFDSGDLLQHYDPADADPTLRVHENQEPILLAGYQREWSPAHHTLLLAGWLNDTLDASSANHAFPMLARRPTGEIYGVPQSGLPVASLDYTTDFEAATAELQHLWQPDPFSLIAGARYQSGEFRTDSHLGESTPVLLGSESGTFPFPFASTPIDQSLAPGFERFAAYGYANWKILDPLLLSAGVAYDHLDYPRNIFAAPISEATDTADAVSPKVGLTLTPWRGGTVRGAFTRSLGGVSFDQSFRLEPTQVAGFLQSYRSVIPESSAGTVVAPDLETYGVAFEQRLANTFFGFELERLGAEADQSVAAVDVGGFPPVYTPSNTPLALDYQEDTFQAYASQLLGDRFSTGVRYRLSEAQLESAYLEIPVEVWAGRAQEQSATLHQLTLWLAGQHPCGAFGRLEGHWFRQSLRGYSPNRPGDDFWQLDAFVGYRFLERRAELGLGFLNLTDQDYRLDPLNYHLEPRRARTFVVSLRLFL